MDGTMAWTGPMPPLVIFDDGTVLVVPVPDNRAREYIYE